MPLLLHGEAYKMLVAAEALIAECDQFDGQDLLETIDGAVDKLREAVLAVRVGMSRP